MMILTLGSSSAFPDPKPNPNTFVPNLAPFNDMGIILANPTAAILAPTTAFPSDPLDALNEDAQYGMKDDHNVDMFLNLQNFEDFEMSTDSTKCKRCEDGEEVTSHAS